MTRDPIQEQIEYYRARAGEYDEWFLRKGRYDRGAELNKRWFSETEIVRQALVKLGPFGETLELAAGTGQWTSELAKISDSVTALDASPETLELNRVKNGDLRVRFVQADLFEWEANQSYDLVFFGFWLSHVPPERFDEFWMKVRNALKPSGVVFFVDSRFESSSTAVDHVLKDETDVTISRKLNDGREFKIFKVFYEPQNLIDRLTDVGLEANVEATPNYFLYGMARLLHQA